MAKTYRPSFRFIGESSFTKNQLVFATRLEAEDYAQSMYVKWKDCVDSKAVESKEPANARFLDFKLADLETV